MYVHSIARRLSLQATLHAYLAALLQTNSMPHATGLTILPSNCIALQQVCPWLAEPLSTACAVSLSPGVPLWMGPRGT